MSLHEKITTDIKESMKAKDAVALNTLRALKSALKYAAIEKLGAEGELEENDALGVVRKQIKQRRDSVESFNGAGRPELAEKELAEITVLERYLPAALSDAELESIVDTAVADTGATGKADMGRVMKRAQELAAGRAEGKVLSAAVAKRLA